MKRTRRQIVSVCLLLAAISCVHHRENFEYIHSVGNDQLFIFDFPMDSCNVCYDTFIACRLNPVKIDTTVLELLVTAINPKGDAFSEIIELPIITDKDNIPHNDISVKKSFQVYDIEWPYRYNVTAGENPGLWKLCIKITDKQAADAVYGIGFTYKGKEHEPQDV